MTKTQRDLQSPADLAAKASRPFPDEPDGYRKARQALLAEEVALRRQLWRVAEQRRALPLGGEVRAYEFIDEDGKTAKLADLCGRHDTLVTYFWMYGPQRERPCPMCTSFLGSIDIPARDIEQRVAFAVIGRSPVARQLAFARERGWRNLKFFQCVGDDFARDYRGLQDDGSEWPILAVWTRRGDKVHLFWADESGGTQDPGQDPHGAPEIAPLWNILDLTTGGRGTDWYPKLEYWTKGIDMTHDTEPVIARLTDWARAIEKRDRAAIRAHHADDLLMFDFPSTVRGIDAYDRTWDFFYEGSQDRIVFRPSNVAASVGDRAAFVSCDMHCEGTSAGPLDFRLTMGLEKRGGDWIIVHEHHSVPTVEERYIGPGAA